MSEKLYTDKLGQGLRSYSADLRVVQGGAGPPGRGRKYVHRQQPGMPDRWMGHKYFTGWIEVKWDRNNLSDNQLRFIHAANRTDRFCAVVIRGQEVPKDFKEIAGLLELWYISPYAAQQAKPSDKMYQEWEFGSLNDLMGMLRQAGSPGAIQRFFRGDFNLV